PTGDALVRRTPAGSSPPRPARQSGHPAPGRARVRGGPLGRGAVLRLPRSDPQRVPFQPAPGQPRSLRGQPSRRPRHLPEPEGGLPGSDDGDAHPGAHRGDGPKRRPPVQPRTRRGPRAPPRTLATPQGRRKGGLMVESLLAPLFSAMGRVLPFGFAEPLFLKRAILAILICAT